MKVVRNKNVPNPECGEIVFNEILTLDPETKEMICTCCFDRKYPDGITSDQARKADERENETDSENSIWDRELLDGITEI